MLKPGIQQSQYSSKTCLFLLHKSFIHGNNGSASLPIWSKPSFIKKHKNIHTGFIPCNIKAVASTATEKSIKVKAVVTVKPTVRGFLSNLGIQRGLDDIKDLLGKTLLLELVSAELDPGKCSSWALSYKQPTLMVTLFLVLGCVCSFEHIGFIKFRFKYTFSFAIQIKKSFFFLIFLKNFYTCLRYTMKLCFGMIMNFAPKIP